jgi:hypothetical protein
MMQLKRGNLKRTRALAALYSGIRKRD